MFVLVWAYLLLTGFVVTGLLAGHMRIQTENTFKDVFPELQLIF